MLEKVLIFIIFLGPLVFFHELGHFFFARLFGVRVEVFSIGFGPKLLKWKKGTTQYALSLIPLGGYVKMFGDDPLSADELSDEEKKVAFTHKGKMARFWIVFGGPLANFILSFFIYLSLVTFGENVPQARFGPLNSETPFYEMGFRSGDALKKINNTNIMSFDDLNLVDSNVESVTVERAGEETTLAVDMKGMEFVQKFAQVQGQLKAPVVADSLGGLYFVSTSSDGPQYDSSLDMILSSNPNSVTLWKIESDLEKVAALEEIGFQKNAFKQVQGTDVREALASEGFYPSDLLVSSIVMNSPADNAKIQKGDIITSINGVPLTGFNELRQRLQTLEKDQVASVTLQREGKRVDISLKPEFREVQGQQVMTIGVYSGVIFMPLKMVESKADGFGEAISSAFYRTKEGIEKTVLGFKKLITAEVSLDTIGGPLAIGQVASDSFNISLSMFFRLMSLISINLGVINLFPIPVLDGGHIVFIFLELINRGPLSRKKIMIAQQFGMSLLFILIFVALFNDISRIF
ncbi:MAG: RIP metalloprotease RseP [Bacteriovoracaceae bacterium]|nr:RIP metalloprotease RseP [Bacteriovoracaceae bacterium]